jgi:hypothetical protein
MHIAVGNDRIVVAIPRLGIVVKVPNIRTSSAHISYYCGMWWMNRRGIRMYPWGNRRFTWYIIEAIGLFLANTVRGVPENWREWTYYVRADAAGLLVPTYISVFGLLNVQAYREPSRERGHAISYALALAAGIDSLKMARYDDNHHFSHSGNFHVPESRTILFLDYGSKKVQRFVTDFARNVLERFDIEQGRAKEEHLKRIIRERDERQ